ncbi:MAG TPA: acyl-ACP--UDP-N-acetylglucosamine O-acyltransferase [bacterium]|nr:acyl-ACP--UDP-N-acetylglucosamine O-acyltransferase [bacterium]
MALIHPTAIVHPKAELGRSVKVGPYCVIDAGVSIGDECELANHVTILGPTVIGAENRFFSQCVIGGEPQDKKFKGEPESRLEIGKGNVFREFVTVNRGSAHGNGVTRMGDDNWMMAYCHVAHDCTVGNSTVFANCSTLAGHVTIEDRVYLGGFTAVHQFCSIGTLTMTGGHTMIAQDVPPYVIATGNRVRLYGVNKIGMQRAGVEEKEIEHVQMAYRIFFRSKLSQQDALQRIEAELGHSPLVARFVRFIRASERGICR